MFDHAQMLKFIGIFVSSSLVHGRGLHIYFSPSSCTKSIVPYTRYDLVVLCVAFKKVIDFHSCFSHLANFLEFVFVYVSFHPCYLGLSQASRTQICL
jgi:hypothetical protein